MDTRLMRLSEFNRLPGRLLAFHGSYDVNITSFKPFTHFGTVKAAVERLEHLSDGSGKPEIIYKVRLHIKNPAQLHRDIENVHSLKDYLYGLLDSEVLNSDELKTITTPDQLIKVLNAKGYDSMTYINTWEDRYSRSWIILNSDQAEILEKFHRYDPKVRRYGKLAKIRL